VADRFYIEANATITNEKGSQISNKAYARESESKKGMDESQITGSASSYARKYALNGLFCIDDTKDADATNTHEETKKAETVKDHKKEIMDLIVQTETDLEKFKAFLKVSNLDDAPYELAKSALMKKVNK
jgi:hypothetical protein